MLDKNYLEYKKKFSSKDPVWLLHTYDNAEDQEIAGLISSSFAYGQVDLINKFISRLMKNINNKPYEFTINFEKRKDTKYLKELNYRFNTHIDLITFINNISKVLKKYGSLKKCFLNSYTDKDTNYIPASSEFVKEINKPVRKNAKGYYHYLLPDPVNGSTCKRLFLFLRWMIRNDEIDPGTWQGLSTSKLIMPVDTHIARISKLLKLIKRGSVDLKFAVELTEKMKEFDPIDPVKYDFSLCHIGIDKKSINLLN